MTPLDPYRDIIEPATKIALLAHMCDEPDDGDITRTLVQMALAAYELVLHPEGDRMEVVELSGEMEFSGGTHAEYIETRLAKCTLDRTAGLMGETSYTLTYHPKNECCDEKTVIHAYRWPIINHYTAWAVDVNLVSTKPLNSPCYTQPLKIPCYKQMFRAIASDDITTSAGLHNSAWWLHNYMENIQKSDLVKSTHDKETP